MAEIARAGCNGTYGSQYTQILSINVNSQSVANNTSNVTITYTNQNTAGTSGNYGWANPATITYTDKDGSHSLSFANSSTDYRNGAVVTLGSWTGNVKHNNDGKLTMSISASFSSQSSSLSGGSVSGTYTLATIPREFTQKPVVSNTSTSAYGASFNWSTSENADYVSYSLNNGAEVSVFSGTATSGSFTINNLSVGTTYSIKIKARRKDSQLSTWSDSINFTTKSNFSQEPIVTMTSNTTSSATFSWSTSENADNVQYFLDGSSSGVQVYSGSAKSGSFTINNLESNTAHTIKIRAKKQDSQLTRDSSTNNFSTSSKTMRVRVNGTWKDATPYIRVNGVWKVVTPFTRINNTWKRGK